MRVLALVTMLGVLAPSASLAARPTAPSPSPVPEDVKLGLAEVSIGVADANDVALSSLPVRPKRAFRVALKNFGWTVLPDKSGWTRLGRMTIHLVRLSKPPPSPGRSGSADIHPLHIGDLAWLVVIRDATIPLLGPPGRPGPPSYVAPLAVFVKTDEPRWVSATTI